MSQIDTIFHRNINDPLGPEQLQQLVETEWLVTNGLGGYASGTVSGALTRVFHGHLISALPSPLGRTMMLNSISEQIISRDGEVIRLDGEIRAESEHFEGLSCLIGFRLESGLPVWTYEVDGLTFEKRLVLPHRQNTVFINYRITSGSGSLKLELRPAVNMRGHEESVNTPLETYSVTVRNRQYELKKEGGSEIPPLRLKLLADDGHFAMDSCPIENLVYPLEEKRGYTFEGDLWSPGLFSIRLDPASEATLVASTENWSILEALSPQQAWDSEVDRKRRLQIQASPSLAQDEAACRLIWAADQFLFTPVGRQQDTVRARAVGDEVRSVIAGYHWFTDWGRDTMISLEGLTLTTGRAVEASYILRTFAHYIRDGLIPNMFPEGKVNGLYHTADATLWFFHATHRYLENTADCHLLDQLLPCMLDIVGHHLRGTLFNIHVDHNDGLLVQGQQGYQLTWMDAKVGDWVVTPRRGKAVEINALWYNALCLLEGWLRAKNRTDEADGIAVHAARCRESFNRRFWNETKACLYDVVDAEGGWDDDAIRPNQLFAVSLDHPVLDENRWEAVVRVAEEKLVTPVGLRSLAPGEKDYKPRYDGDLHARDAAYHQGTVWGWLIGPFIDAWLKVYPRELTKAKTFLSGIPPHLQVACAGTVSEVFDAEPPFTPRGCCAQAWSVAEALRCFARTSSSLEPVREASELLTANTE